MKNTGTQLAAGALVLAMTAAVYGQDKAPASTDKSATATPSAAPANNSFIRLEGTDVHIGSLPPITFHGFFSQGFLASSDYNYLGESSKGSFNFTEMGVNASFSPFERARISVQGFAFDLGEVGRYDPFLDYASLEYSFSDKFGVRAGRIRKPGGLYNHIQDVDLARTSILLPQGVYDARWRDFSTSIDGGEFFGTLPLGSGGSLSYEAFAGMINLTKNGGVSRWIVNGQPTLILNDYEQPPTVGGQLWWNTPVNGLRAGAMVSKVIGFGYDLNQKMGPGPYGPLDAHVNGKGDVVFQQYSLEYQWKSWTFQTEYSTLDNPYRVTQNVYSGSHLLPAPYSSSNSADTQPGSWYVGAAYRFNKMFEVGSYYNEYYLDIHQTGGAPDNYQKDLALSLRVDPTDWWIIKVEGHCIHGTALLQDNADNPVRHNNGWFMLALKTTFSF